MDKTITLLDKMMDIATLRHSVIANNLANANTPGFKRQEVQFRDALRSALETGKASDIAQVSGTVVEDEVHSTRPDGNNVSTHREMAELMENDMFYRVAVKSMSMKLMRLKSAIR